MQHAPSSNSYSQSPAAEIRDATSLEQIRNRLNQIIDELIVPTRLLSEQLARAFGEGSDEKPNGPKPIQAGLVADINDKIDVITSMAAGISMRAERLSGLI